MSIHNKLNLFIKNFLMLDVYENMSDEDKEFMGAMMLGAKVISAFTKSENINTAESPLL